MRASSLVLVLCTLATPAAAGLIGSLSPQDRHYMECEATVNAAGESYTGQAKAWGDCLERAREMGFDEVLPDLLGRVALAEAFAEANKQGLTGTARDELVFRRMATEAEARFPYPTLAATMRSYLISSEGRSRFSAYRDLTLRWLPSDSLKTAGKDHVNDILRKHIEDANFRWAAHGSSAGADADVVLLAQFSATPLAPEGDSFRPVLRVQYEVKASKVDLKSRGKRMAGFTTQAIGRGATIEEAQENALNAVAEQTGAVVLHRVIQEAFRPRNLSQ